jgi:hypothetical protein
MTDSDLRFRFGVLVARELEVPMLSGGREPVAAVVAERFLPPVAVDVDGVDTLEDVDNFDLPIN